MARAPLEQTDFDLREASRRLAMAEQKHDLDMVSVYSDEVDRLLERRHRLTLAADGDD